MKYILMMFTILVIGCEGSYLKTCIDPVKRQSAFDNCLAKIPKGPNSVVYNDWAEVVSECGQQAYHLSLYKDYHCPVGSPKVEY